MSNVSGKLAGLEVSSAEYWVRHVREAVRFADGVRLCTPRGSRATSSWARSRRSWGWCPRACLKSERTTLVASMRPERGEAVSVLEALGG